LIINDTVAQTSGSIVKDIEQDFSVTLDVGAYNWSIECVDVASNAAYSETRFISSNRLTEFSGDTTDLSQVDVFNIVNLTLHVPDVGKMIFLEPVDLSAGADVDSNGNISFNWMEINGTSLPELNKSALLEIDNLSFLNPRIMADGISCDSSQCSWLSYVGGNFTFSVTHFTAYSADESPAIKRAVQVSAAGGGGGGCYPPSFVCEPGSTCTPNGTQMIVCTGKNVKCETVEINQTQSCTYVPPVPAPELPAQIPSPKYWPWWIWLAILVVGIAGYESFRLWRLKKKRKH